MATYYSIFNIFWYYFPLLFEKTPFKKWLLIFLLTIYPVFFILLVYGGYFGIPVSDTTQWGGFLLTFALAFVGIVSRSSNGYLARIRRRSEMPV